MESAKVSIFAGYLDIRRVGSLEGREKETREKEREERKGNCKGRRGVAVLGEVFAVAGSLALGPLGVGRTHLYS